MVSTINADEGRYSALSCSGDNVEDHEILKHLQIDKGDAVNAKEKHWAIIQKQSISLL